MMCTSNYITPWFASLSMSVIHARVGFIFGQLHQGSRSELCEPFRQGGCHDRAAKGALQSICLVFRLPTSRSQAKSSVRSQCDVLLQLLFDEGGKRYIRWMVQVPSRVRCDLTPIFRCCFAVRTIESTFLLPGLYACLRYTKFCQCSGSGGGGAAVHLSAPTRYYVSMCAVR